MSAYLLSAYLRTELRKAIFVRPNSQGSRSSRKTVLIAMVTLYKLLFEIIGSFFQPKYTKKGHNAYLTPYCDMLHVIFSKLSRFIYKLDGVGPVDNRPSTD